MSAEATLAQIQVLYSSCETRSKRMSLSRLQQIQEAHSEPGSNKCSSTHGGSRRGRDPAPDLSTAACWVVSGQGCEIGTGNVMRHQRGPGRLVAGQEELVSRKTTEARLKGCWQAVLSPLVVTHKAERQDVV